ncbi:MAG: PKD domain-containing protein [Phycisphaerae bacterium]
MRNLLTAAAVGTLLALPAWATTFTVATQTGTIQVAGPRTGANGDNFFNIEGNNNPEVNRSYGVARWDVTALRATLDAQYGVGNWQISRVDLVLTQSNAAFSATGGVTLYYTGDDTTDIKTAASPLAHPFFDEFGAPDLAVNTADPVSTYTFAPISTGTIDTYTIYNAGDAGEKLALANDIRNDASGLVSLVFQDSDQFVAATYRGQTASATGLLGPQLAVRAEAIVGNDPPKANAGSNQTVTDVDQGGTENVLLDASLSGDTDGTITLYEWSENAAVIATGATPNVSFAVGTHEVTLRVVDNSGAEDTDTVTITVLSGLLPPIADSGANYSIEDSNIDGSETVALVGAGSFDNDGVIVNYEWTEGGVVISSGASPSQNVSLSLGSHSIRLLVTDDDGLTDFDWVTIYVAPGNEIAGDDFDFTRTFTSFNQTPAAGTFVSAGDGFQIFQRGVSASIPFSLLDDTNAGFPNDNLGIVNSKKLDAWFGINDLDNNENLSGSGTVVWTFDITGETDLEVMVDIAAMGDFEANDSGASSRDDYDWTYSIDGSGPVDLLPGAVNEAVDNTVHTLESGRLITLNDALFVDGVQMNNIFRTFRKPLVGTGSTLTITLNCLNDSDEPYVFDNLFVLAGGLNPGCPGGDTCDQGDVTGDCLVNLTDLATLLANFGSGPVPPQAREDGDTDGDLDVDLTDLARLLSVFGANCQ